MEKSELFKHEFRQGPRNDFHAGDFHLVTVFSSRIVYETINDGIDTWNGVFEENRSYSYSFTHQEFYDRFKDSEDHKPLIDFLIERNYVDKQNSVTEISATSRVALKPMYESLLSGFAKQTGVIKGFWKEIAINYCQQHRHFHTLAHLRSLFAALDAHKTQLMDWEAVQFAVYYHDIVYEVGRNDNEEQSAAWAERVMQSLNIQPDRIDRCKKHILATKGHEKSDDNDTNLFTDADLGILGADPETYAQYCSAIRMEYAVFHEQAYNEGRIKIIRKFLEMPSIYKTEPFQYQYEQTARTNLANELNFLVHKSNDVLIQAVQAKQKISTLKLGKQ